MKKIKKILKVYLIVVGILGHVYVLWLGLNLPLGFDRWLHVSHAPQKAEAIVCVCGGLMGNNLPTQRGMQRIYTTVQLHADGWAPWVIFTGGGSGSLSEGEVYAEVAGWLGLPGDVVLVEAFSGSTAEHPKNLLKLDEMGIERSSSLLVVTSSVHSRRTLMCFKKQGFSDVRMITGYRAKKKSEKVVRSLRESRIKTYKPSQKKYNDFFFRLMQRSGHFWNAVREYVAIVWYWVNGEL